MVFRKKKLRILNDFYIKKNEILIFLFSILLLVFRIGNIKKIYNLNFELFPKLLVNHY